MENTGKPCCRNRLDQGLLVLRIAFGIVFIYSGWGKLFGQNPGMEAFTGMVAGLGFFAPAFFAYAAALTELVGGIAILLGVWTRLFSILSAFVMFVALFMVTKLSFPMASLPLVLLGMAICLACTGSGRYSLMPGKGKSSECGCSEKSECCKA
ncbi:DoxX family protein [Candidatus Uhrbacteria bacterium]|nr:DoxX family protein [Candidatus Uhrbacteria bacterium]